MKKNTLVIFLILMTSIGYYYAQSTTQLFPTQKKQTIKGWGVSLSWWANLVGGMPQQDQDALVKILTDELKYNVFRFNIGAGENPNCTEGDHIRKDGGKMPGFRPKQLDNQGWGIVDVSQDFRQISVLDQIANKTTTPIITEMFSTSPPWWMTKGECVAGNVDSGENLKPEFIDDFADYLVSTTAKLNTDHPKWNISSIEPFNEPASGWWKKGGQQEGCPFSPYTEAQVLWRLWQSQQTYNLNQVLLTANDCSAVPETLSQLTSLRATNPNEYNGIGKVNTHSYKGTVAEKVSLSNFVKTNGNKELWQSETGPLGWNLPAGHQWWERHYTIAERIVEDINNLNSTVWCDWQYLSVDDGWGMIHQTNFDGNDPYRKPVYNRTKGLYARRNFTNFILPGSIIFKTSNTNVLAAMNDKETEYIMVYVNNSDVSKNQVIDLVSLKSIASFETYRTSGDLTTGENLAEKTGNSVTEKGQIINNKLNFTAPAYSVTTFKLNATSTLSNNQNAVLKNRILIRPNPVSTQFEIELTNYVSEGNLSIKNSLGQEVLNKKISNENKISITNFNVNEGIYFLSIFENGKIIAEERIIHQKSTK